MNGRFPPGGVIAHDGSDDDRQFFPPRAASFASRGAVVALPMMRFPGHGDWARDRGASIQWSIRTYRWAWAVLAADTQPGLGFYGHSGGALVGTVRETTDPAGEHKQDPLQHQRSGNGFGPVRPTPRTDTLLAGRCWQRGTGLVRRFRRGASPGA
jgi:hypothetical protein